MAKEDTWEEVVLIDDDGIPKTKSSEKQEDTEDKKPAPEADEEDTKPLKSKTVDPDDDDDESNTVLSRRVQKRISKLTRRWRETEEKVQEREDLIQKLVKEKDELAQRLTNSVNNGVDAVEGQLTKNLALAKKAYKDAFANQDADGLADAQVAISEATAQLQLVRTQKANRPTTQVRKDDEEEDEPQPKQRIYPKEARKWASSKDWWGDNKAATNAAIAIDQELTAEGYDPEEPDYYEELDTRLKKLIPSLYADEADEDEEEEAAPQKKKAKSPLSGSSRSPGKSTKVVRLEETEMPHLNTFGMTKEKWARQKKRVQDAGDGYVVLDI